MRTLRSIGLPDGVVQLAPHSPEWELLFREEAARIRSVLGDLLLGLEHVGSTAIAGIHAKPIIDICAGVSSFEEGKGAIEPLESIGYTYRGEYGIPGRHYFVKGSPRMYHLHMFQIGAEHWELHLFFRDFLRSNPTVARDYERLKLDLADRFRADRVAYTDGKAEFIRSVVARARNETG
jgi:GrpB-like predicted nucleotidyltransferase (UPF0157 family)